MFVVHTNGKAALGETVCQHSEVSDETIPLIPLMLRTLITTGGFRSIVLCDFLTTNYTLRRFGVDPAFLFDFGLPVLTLDTWEHGKTGTVVDVFGGQEWDIGSWIGRTAGRLIPVPIGSVDVPGAYCSLPDPLKIGRPTRRHIRSNLGVDADSKAVLFCTADWQHGAQGPNRPKVSTQLPQILAGYLARLGPNIRLIHVGPTELPIDMDGRYLWMPPMRPTDFDRLLNSVDMVLSANVSATSLGKAIALGIPVLVVRNSYSAKTVEELEAVVPGGITPGVRAWAGDCLPLYPFSMWPLGFWKFLRPLLDFNPYCSAINMVELTDDSGFLDVCRSLLFDEKSRQSNIQRQAEYTDRVRKLPGAAELIHGYLARA